MVESMVWNSPWPCGRSRALITPRYSGNREAKFVGIGSVAEMTSNSILFLNQLQQSSFALTELGNRSKYSSTLFPFPFRQ